MSESIRIPSDQRLGRGGQPLSPLDDDRIQPLPNDCPTPASGNHAFEPFWRGVEARRAGTKPYGFSSGAGNWLHELEGFWAQDDIARTLGYAE